MPILSRFEVLDKYLHPNGVEYAWIINSDGEFATVTQAELDAMILEAQKAAELFGYDPEECTCTPDIDAACPACVRYVREKFGQEIPAKTAYNELQAWYQQEIDYYEFDNAFMAKAVEEMTE